MKNILSLLACLLILLAGCAPVSATTPTTLSNPTETQTRSVIVPTVISTPKLTLAPQSPTSTAIPTLSVENARAKLLELLAKNGGCELPCLWGIMPGRSTIQETKAILFSLSSLSVSPHLDSRYVGDIMPRYIDGDFELYTNISFLADHSNQIINSIHLSAEAHKILESGYENLFDSKTFGDKISAYNLAQVLSEQGIPSSVMIATSGGPLTRGGTGGFDVLLLYPDQGILINYTTQMYIIDTHVRGCLSNAHVQMELYPPGSGTSFFDLLKQTYWPQKMEYYKPIEESTSMSVETFYATFSKTTEQCIETPVTLWPTPEP